MKNIFTLVILFYTMQSIGQIQLAEDKIVLTNEAKVNSEHLEYSPTFYKNGIVFISTRSKSLAFNIKDANIGTNVMSIYESKRDSDGFLEKPEPFAYELISKIHEGPLTFNATGNELYFTRNDSKTKASDGKKKLQIYAAQLIGNEWKNIKGLPFNQTEYNFMHPAISIDNNVLYFSSDMPGGFGGMDLYKVEKTDSTWSTPQNLGPEINTSTNEVFPFIHADGTLYFSSNGHNGLGGLDIFYSYLEGENLEEEKWVAPINLEQPFNSNLDDLGFIIDLGNKNGYFSSNRKTGSGKDDIYSFYYMGNLDIVDSKGKKRKKQKAILVLKDEEGNPLQGAKISYVELGEIVLTNGEENAVRIQPNGENEFVLNFDMDEMGKTKYSNSDGIQDVVFKEGNYILTISKQGYVPQQILITPDTNLDNLNINLQKAANCIALNGEVLTRNKMIRQSGTAVQITDVETKEAITVYSEADGSFQYCLPCNRIFTLFADKNGVNSTPIIISTKELDCTESAAISTKLYLNGEGLMPIAGIRIQLPNIYFNFDDAALRPDARKDLEAVEALLTTYPDMRVELASYTDARGSNDYNYDLSRRRSQSIYNYLVLKGIEGNQMEVKGYGQNDIRNRCVDGVSCSESEHQFNRRTEIIVLSTEPSNSLSSINEEPDGLFILNGDENNIETGKGMPESFINQSPSKITNSESPKIENPIKESTQEFLVIAGTFKFFENALSRKQELIDVGFEDVTILELPSNNMNAVCVQKTKLESTANELVEELDKYHKITAYVRDHPE